MKKALNVVVSILMLLIAFMVLKGDDSLFPVFLILLAITRGKNIYKGLLGALAREEGALGRLSLDTIHVLLSIGILIKMMTK